MPVKRDSAATELRALVEEERITEARELLAEALEEHGDEPELLQWKVVLAPPKATPRRIRDADRTQEVEWIVANREAYRGRGVAVSGDKLVADAASFRDLQLRIKDLKAETPLVHHFG